MEYEEIIEAIGREAADLPPGRPGAGGTWPDHPGTVRRPVGQHPVRPLFRRETGRRIQNA